MFYFLVYLMYFLFGSDVVALFFFLHFVFLYLAVVVGGGYYVVGQRDAFEGWFKGFRRL